MDRRIQAGYPGRTLTRAEYEEEAAATLWPCACGGTFSYHAPPRCPECRSTPEQWDEGPTAPEICFD